MTDRFRLPILALAATMSLAAATQAQAQTEAQEHGVPPARHTAGHTHRHRVRALHLGGQPPAHSHYADGTGNSAVGDLNASQLDQNYKGPWHPVQPRD